MSNFKKEEIYEKNFNFSTWKNLFEYIIPYKKNFIILIIQLVLISIVDSTVPLINKIAIDKFIIPKSYDGIILFSSLLFIFVTLHAINIGFLILNAGKLEVQIPYDLRKRTFEKLQTLQLSYFDNTPTGWILSRISSDTKKLGHSLSWNLVDMFWSITTMIFMVIVMCIINIKLALLVLLTVPVLILVSIKFQKSILFNYRNIKKVNSHITNSYNESIMGVNTIKTLVTEKSFINEFQDLTSEMKTHSVRSAIVSSIYTPIVILLGSISIFSVLWKGGEYVIIDEISCGTLVAFLTYTAQFYEPVKQFSRIFGEFQYSQASAERVLGLINTEVTIIENKEVTSKYGHLFYSDKKLWPTMKGTITFKNVSFGYNPDSLILENFNLKIFAGEKIGIIGETGSGKSTIVNLSCRFYEPTLGNIYIDGFDYKEMPLLWLQSNIGYVLQDPYLFSGTILENILYGRNTASFEEVVESSKLVNAHDFIQKLPKGYDTPVGERGSLLSTGQKQLISFARAILKNPKIFIFDEATSSVDTQTESLINESLKNIFNDRTSLIIAHRLSTVRYCDRIIVIKKGQIVESGNHNDLLSKKGHYFELFSKQI